MYSYLFVSEQNNKRSYNRCCRLIYSPTEEIGLRLPVLLRILPDMIRDEWPSNEAHIHCV